MTGITTASRIAFFRSMVARQIRQDYLNNLTGFAWLVLQPLLLLAIYAFVFSTIFQARIPDAGDIGFVPYLAVAFWPWTAFSEAVLKASASVTGHSGLVTKVAFPNEYLPLATVTATFLMHLVGYVVVLALLELVAVDLHWAWWPAVLPVLLLLWLLACAISLFTSATQVFVRDLAQMLPPLMTFWFFATPILYSTSLLPESLATVMRLNPMTWFVETLRELLLFGHLPTVFGTVLALLGTPLLFVLALAYFRRFSGHFEDFL